MIDFIPCTMERNIGGGVFFRPIKSWHSATFAGEGLYKIPNSDDGSGCLRKQTDTYKDLCPRPLTVTHRIYWHTTNRNKQISAFLSYPNGMGWCGDEYFWEAYGFDGEDIIRWTGNNAEAEMEKQIRRFFRNKL